MDSGLLDISADWTKFLGALFKLMEVAKIPHKSKSYDQAVYRTMFFKKLSDTQPAITFDGKHYPVTSASNLDHFNCRMDLMSNVWPKFQSEDIEDQMNPTNYKAYKTNVAKALKDWDKRYVKHQKSHHPEIAAIQHESMEPLTNLFESNFCYHNLTKMIEKGEYVPGFRILALEERYCVHIMEMCRIFKEFGKLEDPFNME